MKLNEPILVQIQAEAAEYRWMLRLVCDHLECILCRSQPKQIFSDIIERDLVCINRDSERQKDCGDELHG